MEPHLKTFHGQYCPLSLSVLFTPLNDFAFPDIKINKRVKNGKLKLAYSASVEFQEGENRRQMTFIFRAERKKSSLVTSYVVASVQVVPAEG
jgi:hypothetical protein